MCQVEATYRTLKLQRLGFPDSVISLAETLIEGMPSAAVIAPDRVPFANVKDLPVISIVGFPADTRAREIRLLVCLLPGYKGIASRIFRGMLIVFIWWQTRDQAAWASTRLTRLRMDHVCAAALDITLPKTWSAPHDPPPIHI